RSHRSSATQQPTNILKPAHLRFSRKIPPAGRSVYSMKSQIFTKVEAEVVAIYLEPPEDLSGTWLAVKTSGTEFKFHKLVRPLHPRRNRVG
ncbi:unnamed protein product, partial [Heterotrigona itama]